MLFRPEQQAHNVGVEGSSPSLSTNEIKQLRSEFSSPAFACQARLLEFLPPNPARVAWRRVAGIRILDRERGALAHGAPVHGREVAVRIETNEDLEIAIARLASRAPEVLATFIASLAFDGGPIGEQVRTFIVSDDLSETSASLKERIDALRRSRRANHRHRADEELGERLGYILRSIETLVLPLSPTRAFELLVLLIERDGDAMEQCGDDSWSVQMHLETAASLIATAMKTLPSIEVRQTLERLVAEDGCGTRTPLANVLANRSKKP